MPFNQDTKRKIVLDRKTGEYLPCLMCGTTYPLPDAAHIIDEAEWKSMHGCDSQENGMPLCPNCHRVFDDVLRPRLYAALNKFGTTGLPVRWKTGNKNRVTDKDVGPE
jgi:5-methylcytosine-specific restriction endonuclease McrA